MDRILIVSGKPGASTRGVPISLISGHGRSTTVIQADSFNSGAARASGRAISTEGLEPRAYAAFGVSFMPSALVTLRIVPKLGLASLLSAL